MGHEVHDEAPRGPEGLEAPYRLPYGRRMVAVVVHEEDAPRLAEDLGAPLRAGEAGEGPGRGLELAGLRGIGAAGGMRGGAALGAQDREGQRQGGRRVEDEVPPGHAKLEGAARSRQGEARDALPRLEGNYAVGPLGLLAVRRHRYVAPLAADSGGRLGGARVVGAVDQLPARGEEAAILDEGREDVGVGREVVLVVVVDAGQDDPPRLEVEEVAAVLAGLGDEEAPAQAQRTAAAEARDRRADQDGRGKGKRAQDGAAHRGRRRLAVDAGDARGVEASRIGAQGLGIGHEGDAGGGRGGELGIPLERVGGRVYDQVRSRDARGLESRHDLDSDRGENCVRVESVGDV